MQIETNRPIVIVSSTALDLPAHRQEALDACLRQGMIPRMQEHLPASSVDATSGAEAVRVSLSMVDEAEIYLGIFARRYGYVPAGHDTSIVEMEYDRAVERGIPRLIFLMHEDHPLKASDVETGEGAVKLGKLRERLQTENVVKFFKSPEDLRAHAIDSLSQYRKSDVTAFHYIRDIPACPESYIAHPYTLLQTKSLVGRQAELNLLTDWVTVPRAEVYQARILNIVALGGEGKSALAWKWFNNIAPKVINPLAGQMWWSFYESDAYFENFIIRALAYVSKQTKEAVQQIPQQERERQLLAIIDREPFLLVLDGLERILIAYTRMDAAHLADDELDKQTHNVVVGASNLPEGIADSFISQHRLRKTADPRAGAFLRKLAGAHASRILISSRLYPAELQTIMGRPISGSYAHFLSGLSDDDAVNLWRAFGASGSREELIDLFHTFGNHALLIHVLASEVAHYRQAPGDFDRWRRDQPDFNPFSLPLKQAKSHVLAFALRGLNEGTRKVLHTIAAFRMPATYDTLTALLVGKAKGRLFADETTLVAVLAELEDRGLLGWDKRANRYDLHPIVRGVIWSGLDNAAKKGIYRALNAHFESIPPVEIERFERVEELTPTIELYNTLIGLQRYDDAGWLFYNRLNKATKYHLNANRQRIELLELLFSDGLDALPRHKNPEIKAFILNALAAAYGMDGRVGQAVPLLSREIDILETQGKRKNISVGFYNLATALRQAGNLYESESAARRALLIPREENRLIRRGDRALLSSLIEENQLQEGAVLHMLGLVLATRGLTVDASVAFRRALLMFERLVNYQGQGAIHADYAQQALWQGDYKSVQYFANVAKDLAGDMKFEFDVIRALRLHGSAALGLGDLVRANERLQRALARARAVNFVEEELPTLIGLAESQRLLKNLESAREFLQDAWDPSERGPYQLFRADAYNVLAQVERDAGDHSAAVVAATAAYRLAWCDGPPFSYHWGLEKARAHLAELGEPMPEMLPFDESERAPMIIVDINTLDVFGRYTPLKFTVPSR